MSGYNRYSRRYPLMTLTFVLLSVSIASARESRAKQPLVGHVQELLHRNSISQHDVLTNQQDHPLTVTPRRNSKSMSFIEYFFPSSRTAKVTNLSNNTTNEQISNSTQNTVSELPETTNVPEIASTQEEARATGATKKSTSNGKRKQNSRQPTNTTPKIKSSTQNNTTSPRPTTHKTNTTPMKSTTTSSTSYKTTHKHYTIHPNIKISQTTPKPKTSETTTKPSVSSTTNEVKVKQTTIVGDASSSVSESATEKLESTSQTETAATDLDGREGELDLKPQTHHVKINDQTKKETVPLPAGSTSVLAKPTKYHYYPHNQHIYLLPECAIQQVCNAVYVRLNYTQPLCACPARHRDPCSASLNADDMHTTQLTTDSKKRYAYKAVTLVKTCEATSEMRECRAPRDWSLLALQNIRTGKSHYLVICRCPEDYILEGPMSHDQPTYASVPGIRVYGMMCVQPTRNQASTTAYNSVTGRPSTVSYKLGYSQPYYNQEQGQTRYPGFNGGNSYYNRMARTVRDTDHKRKNAEFPPIPWDKVKELVDGSDWEN